MKIAQSVKNMTGPTWDRPLVKIALKILDPFDYIVRVFKKIPDMPRLSLRVRSNGIRGQFGGGKFDLEGAELLDVMKQYVPLNATDTVLEVGCGVGRTARHMQNYLTTGAYIGMDIEPVSVDTAKKLFGVNDRFRVEHMDIQNGLYNPNGKYTASVYEFPYEDNSFDLVFHFSVFTHMLEPDVKRYISEVGRILKPGGCHCFSTFLIGIHPSLDNQMFSHQKQSASVQSLDAPEVAVGYTKEFFDAVSLESGMVPTENVLYGKWRQSEGLYSDRVFQQDILFYEKET